MSCFGFGRLAGWSMSGFSTIVSLEEQARTSGQG